MTRQEELNDAWYKEMGKGSVAIMQALAFALRWCDQHPHWISVEDKLPPMRDEEEMSDIVLTHTKGGVIYINRYDYRGKTWGNPLAFNVTHWMPLPSIEHLRETTKMIEKGGEDESE